MKTKTFFSVLLLFCWFVPTLAGADARGERFDSKAPAVKKPLFSKASRHELTPNFSMTTNDPFFQNYYAGISYNYHLAEWISIGAVVNYTFAQPTGLTNKLKNKPFEVTPDVRQGLLWLAAEARFAPIYGKLNFFSEVVVHYDLFFTLSAGLFITNPPLVTGDPNLKDPDGMGFSPFGGIGVGQRYFLLRWLAVRWEFRGLFMPENFKRLADTQLRVDLAINVGFSFFF
jgi:outer membrane beta-barrel protein